IPGGIDLDQCLQFQAAGTGFPALQPIERVTRIAHLAILLPQIKNRRGIKAVAVLWLELYSQLPLFAFKRLKRLASGSIDANTWLEGLAVAQIGRHAIVEQVRQGVATCYSVIFLRLAPLDLVVSPVF